MDLVALFTSSEGRLAPTPFWLGLVAVYLASIASQFLLAGALTARAGVWPFVLVQAGVLWSWTVLHIKRLRDAGRGPAGAIGVAVLYGLSIGLILLLIAAFTTGADLPPGGEPAHAALGFFLLIAILAVLVSPDLGIFTIILKMLVLIACLPAVISTVFSLLTGLRRGVPQ
jgi:uncharacterized membrane protein YhaH (DUF805 family)